jgi:uncharacterized membrane protein
MRTLLILALWIVVALVFAVLSIAAFNIYSLLGAVVFSIIVGAALLWMMYLIHTGFRTLDRSRFMREYNTYLAH